MINRLCIIGLGLMGGSLAAALKQRGAVKHVVATGRRDVSLKRGLEMGIIDSWTLDLAEAVQGADIIVICTPTQVAEQTLADLKPLLTDDMVLTDVASVKGNLKAAAERVFGEAPKNFVLAHPIAGSEKHSVEASNPDLYVDHRGILTPLANTDASAVEKVAAMWSAAGADLVYMEVEDHDRVLAPPSHLPHLMAFALVDALAQDGAAEEIFKFAAGGFRDFTRIASSDPKMWHDICLANSDAVLERLNQLTDNIDRLREAIETGDGETLMKSFANAKHSRDNYFLTQYKHDA